MYLMSMVGRRTDEMCESAAIQHISIRERGCVVCMYVVCTYVCVCEYGRYILCVLCCVLCCCFCWGSLGWRLATYRS